MSFRNVTLALVTGFALVACGGGSKDSSSTSTTTTTQSSPASNATDASGNAMSGGSMSGGSMSGGSMAAGAMATVPPTLNCGAVKPVWANTKTHVYHEPNDPMYGRTKHGEYLCPSQAKAQGYHKAGSRAHMKSSMDSSSESGGQ